MINNLDRGSHRCAAIPLEKGKQSRYIRTSKTPYRRQVTSDDCDGKNEYLFSGIELERSTLWSISMLHE